MGSWYTLQLTESWSHDLIRTHDVVEVADANRGDGGDDGQEQSGGSKEDKSGKGTMAIALATDPNSDYESCQYGTTGQQCIYMPYPVVQGHQIVWAASSGVV